MGIVEDMNATANTITSAPDTTTTATTTVTKAPEATTLEDTKVVAKEVTKGNNDEPLAMPSSWKKDRAERWSKLDRETQMDILEESKSQQADYTRKTQELAEQRKAFDAEKGELDNLKSLASYISSDPNLSKAFADMLNSHHEAKTKGTEWNFGNAKPGPSLDDFDKFLSLDDEAMNEDFTLNTAKHVKTMGNLLKQAMKSPDHLRDYIDAKIGEVMGHLNPILTERTESATLKQLVGSLPDDIKGDPEAIAAVNEIFANRSKNEEWKDKSLEEQFGLSIEAAKGKIAAEKARKEGEAAAKLETEKKRREGVGHSAGTRQSTHGSVSKDLEEAFRKESVTDWGSRIK